ncbi:archaemetzincin [Singulisphaera sp. PoT]|uniref:archaemetzincin n=1 Tax=Singulisphaera sp. PoT TaxID=3411797 RepID=UPI003BF60B89
MGVRAWRAIALVGLAFGLAFVARSFLYGSIPEEEFDPYGPDGTEVAAWENDERRADLETAGRLLLPLHRKMGEPQPGDWLANHPESGQTFEEYGAGKPNRPSARRTTLYIQPWGNFDAEQTRLIAETSDFLKRFYGIPVKVLDRLRLEDVPSYARPRHPDRDDERLTTSYALGVLQRRCPKDAVGVLALTTADLTPREGRSWVFGQASLMFRVGVWSLYRQGDLKSEPALVLRRTIQTAVHETGHMLGIQHCTAYQCGMNGTGSREEADSRPLAFCPECEMKVWWACSLDPSARYADLIAFARGHGFEPDARFWRESRARLERTALASKRP